MTISKQPMRILILYVSLIIVAGVIQLLLHDTNISYQCMVVGIYLYIFFHWRFSIKRRFMQQDMQRILVLAADLMILWVIIRTTKYSFTPPDGLIIDILWYSYYIPFTLIPLLMFIATIYIRTPDFSSIARLRNLICIPVTAVIAGIMTNNIHELAFRFSDSTHKKYTYGPFYYAAIIILAISIIGILVNVFYMCIKRHFLNHIWLTILVLLLGILYLYIYVNKIPGGDTLQLEHFFKMPDFTCMFFISFWESLVCTHMIPSNTDHNVFFAASSINAGLTDYNYNIILNSSTAVIPEPKLIESALYNPVILNNGTHLLKVVPVNGGYFYWVEDIEELSALNNELVNTGSYLEEEHLMLEASIRLHKNKQKAIEQNRLYDKIIHSLRPQLDTLSDILDNLPEDEETFRYRMKHAAIIASYFKRRSNLLLLAEQYPSLSTRELYLSINESMSYIQMEGILCNIEMDEADTKLNSELILLLYALYGNTCQIYIELPDN